MSCILRKTPLGSQRSAKFKKKLWQQRLCSSDFSSAKTATLKAHLMLDSAHDKASSTSTAQIKGKLFWAQGCSRKKKRAAKKASAIEKCEGSNDLGNMHVFRNPSRKYILPVSGLHFLQKCPKLVCQCFTAALTTRVSQLIKWAADRAEQQHSISWFSYSINLTLYSVQVQTLCHLLIAFCFSDVCFVEWTSQRSNFTGLKKKSTYRAKNLK